MEGTLNLGPTALLFMVKTIPLPSIAVARLTFASGLRQPLTWLVLLVGIALIGLSYLFGMFSFEDSNRMRLLITAGVASSSLAVLFLGVLSIAQGVHDELSSRTAQTLFAKPLARHHFLIGKVLGTIALVSMVAILLLIIHLLSMWFAQSTGFDLSERHRRYHDPSAVGFVPWGSCIAAHALGLIANSSLICLAGMLALLMPMALTTLVSFAAFILAHLSAGYQGLLPIDLLLPQLHLFQVDDSLHFADVSLSSGYFLLCFAHAVLYGIACLVVGSAVLTRRDLP